jgi:hypothetical protein
MWDQLLPTFIGGTLTEVEAAETGLPLISAGRITYAGISSNGVWIRGEGWDWFTPLASIGLGAPPAPDVLALGRRGLGVVALVELPR